MTFRQIVCMEGPKEDEKKNCEDQRHGNLLFEKLDINAQGYWGIILIVIPHTPSTMDLDS